MVRKSEIKPSNLQTARLDNESSGLLMRKIFHGKNFAADFLGIGSQFLIPAILTLVFISAAALGQTLPTVNMGAPPAWVDWPAPEAEAKVTPDQSSHGQVFILFDQQVNAATSETFVHVEKEITSGNGVQNGANLTFPYDPSFHKLILHQITIHRGAQSFDHLDPAKFKIIQQETDLNRQIYNGTLSALLLLEDVRVGDRIEYAYTLSGANPVLQGRFMDTFLMKWSVPVKHLRYRLLWPEDRKLNFKTHGSEVEPVVHDHDGLKDYIWDLHNLPAGGAEEQTPSWYPAYPWLQLSEFNNWSDVAMWASGLYVNTNLESPELKEEIANLRQTGASMEQTVQATLDFVQNDIRYLGIEFGPNSYHPTDPVTVLQRRFGDCKDKAFLLCTLLRGLGYEATPVLVATGFRHTLPDLLPAPHDFDHVIVRFYAYGKTWWLDPTRQYQHGPAAERYLPDYGYGLQIQPWETELTPIPASNVGLPETFTTEMFFVGPQKASTRLTVVSTLSGFDAEWMRAVLASMGREELAKSYLNDYARRYSGVAPEMPMTVKDFPKSDMLILTHSYIITNFWVLSPDKQHYNCGFYPLGIHSWIIKPTTSIRSAPLEISFPRRRIVQTTIHLPREFRLSDYTNIITGPAAELHIQRTVSSRMVILNYEYLALTNFVPVSMVATHLDSIDRMENALGYSLVWQNADTSGTSQFNWPIFLLAACYCLLLATGAVLLYRFQCRPSANTSPLPPVIEPGVSGLGGWLVLVGLGLVLNPFRLVYFIDRTTGSFSLWRWQDLTTPGSLSYQPGMGSALVFELLCQLTLLALCLFTIVLFFQKRRAFPRWFIVTIAFNAIFAVADAIAVQGFLKMSTPQTRLIMVRALMGAVVSCSIWIPYMCVSRRVKATFVK
jgi:transglutaminase-like putative cysteine protease/mannose/fructose/N-acetylgalactosamine-specific phosphotransferase system component IIC